MKKLFTFMIILLAAQSCGSSGKIKSGDSNLGNCRDYASKYSWLFEKKIMREYTCAFNGTILTCKHADGIDTATYPSIEAFVREGQVLGSMTWQERTRYSKSTKSTEIEKATYDAEGRPLTITKSNSASQQTATLTLSHWDKQGRHTKEIEVGGESTSSFEYYDGTRTFKKSTNLGGGSYSNTTFNYDSNMFMYKSLTDSPWGTAIERYRPDSKEKVCF